MRDWFELGTRAGTEYWLEAQLVNGNEFLFNGRLFHPNRPGAAGTVIDNFPKSAAPAGWTKQPMVQSGDGYPTGFPKWCRPILAHRVDAKIIM